jgi:hypothetical protein
VLLGDKVFATNLMYPVFFSGQFPSHATSFLLGVDAAELVVVVMCLAFMVQVARQKRS